MKHRGSRVVKRNVKQKIRESFSNPTSPQWIKVASGGKSLSSTWQMSDSRNNSGSCMSTPTVPKIIQASTKNGVNNNFVLIRSIVKWV